MDYYIRKGLKTTRKPRQIYLPELGSSRRPVTCQPLIEENSRFSLTRLPSSSLTTVVSATNIPPSLHIFHPSLLPWGRGPISGLNGNCPSPPHCTDSI